MKRVLLAMAVTLLLGSLAYCDGITITGPTEPVQVTEQVQLSVKGLTDADLPKARVIVWPRERTTMVPARTWGGDPFIWFSARLPGTYLIAMAVPLKDGTLGYSEISLVVGPTPPDPDPEPTAVNPHKPAPQWSQAVTPVSKEKMVRKDATVLAQMYSTVAKDLEQGSLKLSSTLDLRQALVERGGSLGLKGKYPKVAAQVEGALSQALGKEVVPLDTNEAAAFLRTLAWAVWESGKGGKR